jgi:hypothetical protein
MTTKDMDFKVVPLNMLPSELADNSTPEKVEEEKRIIRETILEKTNTEIASGPNGGESLALLRALGSDLNINAFALNFRLTPGGEWNTDVEEANYLMSRVIEVLSVDSPDDDPSKLPFVLTSTTFSDKLYGECAATFKSRLGLRRDKLDLMVLRNVVMNPFPTQRNFIGDLAEIFKSVVKEEVKVGPDLNSTSYIY